MPARNVRQLGASSHITFERLQVQISEPLVFFQPPDCVLPDISGVYIPSQHTGSNRFLVYSQWTRLELQTNSSLPRRDPKVRGERPRENPVPVGAQAYPLY